MALAESAEGDALKMKEKADYLVTEDKNLLASSQLPIKRISIFIKIPRLRKLKLSDKIFF